MKLRYKLRVREARKKMKACKARKKMKEHTKQRHDSTQARKVCEHVKHVGTQDTKAHEQRNLAHSSCLQPGA